MKNNQSHPPLNPNKALAFSAGQQIRQILTLLNVDYHESGKWLLGCCPVHKGDNRTAFNYSLDKNYWICRTSHCEEQYGKSIIGLIAGIRNCGLDEVYGWLVENIEECEFVQQSVKIEPPPYIYPEACLQRLFKTDFYAKKGYSSETLAQFHHGLAESGPMRKRVVFPIRNQNDQIVGFSGRWTGEESKSETGKLVCLNNATEVPKWKHSSFPKSDYIYNYSSAKSFCEKELIVVESIGNCMRWWDAGFKNVVACLGSSISPKQSKLLIPMTRHIILALDTDKAGIKGSKFALSRLEHFVKTTTLFTPDERDWAQLTNEEVRTIYGQITN